jgi:hypothetical protein
VVLLLIIGFPVALILAWAFEPSARWYVFYRNAKMLL